MTLDQKQAGSVPVTDPTTLTTAALEREVANLHEKIEDSTRGLAKELQTAIDHRGELMDARFETVGLQFKMTEEQRKEQKTDTKTEVASAFAAAKEAVKEQTLASEKSINKSETATAEAIKQLNATFTVAIEGVKRSIDDLKESTARSIGDAKERNNSLDVRLAAAEAARNGNPLKERVVTMESERRGGKENAATIIASIAIAGVVVSLLITFLELFAK